MILCGLSLVTFDMVLVSWSWLYLYDVVMCYVALKERRLTVLTINRIIVLGYVQGYSTVGRGR